MSRTRLLLMARAAVFMLARVVETLGDPDSGGMRKPRTALSPFGGGSVCRPVLVVDHLRELVGGVACIEDSTCAHVRNVNLESA